MPQRNHGKNYIRITCDFPLNPKTMIQLFSYLSKYIIYEDKIMVDEVEYEIRLVGRIFSPKALKPSFGETVINLAVLIAGLVGLFTFSIVWSILGLIAIVICGYNLRDLYKQFKNPEYVVLVSMKPNIDVLYLQFKTKEHADKYYHILNEQWPIAVQKYKLERED